MSDLHHADAILLLRCKNGWVVAEDCRESAGRWVFESTESLAKNLVRIVGKSGWVIERKMPERDERGHFVPQKL